MRNKPFDALKILRCGGIKTKPGNAMQNACGVEVQVIPNDEQGNFSLQTLEASLSQHCIMSKNHLSSIVRASVHYYNTEEEIIALCKSMVVIKNI